MLRYVELPYRYYMYEDFSLLNKLYPGDPVEVGYHGNVYQVTVDSARNMDSYAFFDTRYHLAIRELKEEGYVTIGEGTFDGGAYLYHDSLELRSQIKSAIIQLNIKPTDYYK